MSLIAFVKGACTDGMESECSRQVTTNSIKIFLSQLIFPCRCYYWSEFLHHFV